MTVRATNMCVCVCVSVLVCRCVRTPLYCDDIVFGISRLTKQHRKVKDE